MLRYSISYDLNNALVHVFFGTVTLLSSVICVFTYKAECEMHATRLCCCSTDQKKPCHFRGNGMTNCTVVVRTVPAWIFTALVVALCESAATI